MDEVSCDNVEVRGEGQQSEKLRTLPQKIERHNPMTQGEMVFGIVEEWVV